MSLDRHRAPVDHGTWYIFWKLWPTAFNFLRPKFQGDPKMVNNCQKNIFLELSRTLVCGGKLGNKWQSNDFLRMDQFEKIDRDVFFVSVFLQSVPSIVEPGNTWIIGTSLSRFLFLSEGDQKVTINSILYPGMSDLKYSIIYVQKQDLQYIHAQYIQIFRHDINQARYDARWWTAFGSECVWGSSFQWYNQLDSIIQLSTQIIRSKSENFVPKSVVKKLYLPLWILFGRDSCMQCLFKPDRSCPVWVLPAGKYFSLFVGHASKIHLQAILGHRRMEERVSLILVTVFYLVVFLCGLVGNLLVCIVIARSKCLHSAMNYYLISLALADLILLILGKN